MTLASEYQVKYLFLPVGRNPLPVFVSAWMQVKPGGRAYLLHTPATVEIAQNILCTLYEVAPEIQVILRAIDSVAPDRINETIETFIKKDGLQRSDNVGLNFTGGTKPMVIHTLLKTMGFFFNPFYYYLDADTLKLHGLNKDFQPLPPQEIRDEKQVSLAQMAALQGGVIKSSCASLTPLSQPVIDILVHLSQDEMTKWIEWRSNNLNWVKLHKPWKNIVKSAKQWSTATIQLPGEEPLSRLTRALTGEDGPAQIGVVAQTLNKRSGVLINWLEGDWLEEYTWQCLESIQDECKLRDVYANVKPDYPNMIKAKNAVDSIEIDVVAVRGMQLFVFSCTTGNNVDRNKQKLFEVFTRARLIGGDEARLAVISTVENPEEVETQLKEGWQTNQIKVFGRKSLPNLSQEIKEWIEDVNKNKLAS